MNNIKTIQKYILYIFIFLYPLAYLPFFLNRFEITKVLLLVLTASVFLLLKISSWVMSEKISIKYDNSDVLITLFGTLYLLSGLVIAKNTHDAFITPGTSSIIFLGSVIYLSYKNLDNPSKIVSTYYFVGSVVTLAILQILSFSGLTSAIPQLPNTFKEGVYAVSGGGTNLVMFMVLGFVLSFKNIVNDLSTNTVKAINTIACFIVAVGLLISAYSMLPGKSVEFKRLDFSSSWVVALDTVKNNILGSGPGYFSSAYLKSRPLLINYTKDWNLVYQQSFNTPLTAFTELGVIGVTLWIIITLFFLSKFGLSGKQYLPGIIALIAAWLLPLNQVYMPVLFYALSLGDKENDKQPPSLTLPKLFHALTVVVVLFGVYMYSRYFVAEYVFSDAVVTLSKNDPLKSYNKAISAININNRADYYHLLVSQLDLAMVHAIGKNEKLEEKDQQDISNLLQQAVSENKIAVSLNPTKSANWEALGNTYNILIPYAKGSESFAIESYKQSIFLNPLSPNLRIKLGGIFFNLKKI